MTRDQAVVGVPVLYEPWAAERRTDRYGMLVRGPDERGMVHVRLGSATYEVHLAYVTLAPRPFVDDLDLIDAMKKEMKFVDDPRLTNPKRQYVQRALEVAQNKLELIQYFEAAYQNTNQDTVFYGPELVIVVRNILAGKRPVKLRFLTDFEGEEK